MRYIWNAYETSKMRSQCSTPIPILRCVVKERISFVSSSKYRTIREGWYMRAPRTCCSSWQMKKDEILTAVFLHSPRAKSPLGWDEYVDGYMDEHSTFFFYMVMEDTLNPSYSNFTSINLFASRAGFHQNVNWGGYPQPGPNYATILDKKNGIHWPVASTSLALGNTGVAGMSRFNTTGDISMCDVSPLCEHDCQGRVLLYIPNTSC